MLLSLGAGPVFAQAAPPQDLQLPPAASEHAAPEVPSRSTGRTRAPLAPTARGGVIAQIRVEGTQRIEQETVISYLTVSIGQAFDTESVDLSLKRLFATGLFADVVMRREGNDLVVHVVENPIINRVVFEGNKAKKEEDLSKEVEIRPRTVFTRARVQADVTRVVELYRRAGRFAAKVTPKVVELPQNRVDLIFEIREGSVTGVGKINFIGNRAFTDRELRKVIVTRQTGLGSIFSSNANYDPDRVAYDREQLRKHYIKNGYADFAVVSTVAELTPDAHAFIITYAIDEGQKYKFGNVTVETTLTELDPKRIEKAINIKPGEIYNADRIDSAIDTITFGAGVVGYAFVDVKQRLNKRADQRIMDVVLQVNEGPRVYVERINIRGNTRTLDKVVRREIRIAEGDPYNRVLVDRSRARIRGLGFFKEVEIKEQPGTAGDRTILDVAVTEQPTGEVALSLGYSSETSIIDLSITERNLLGRGQYLRVDVSTSSLAQQLSLSFTEPYFLDRNLSFGYDVYKVLADYTRFSGYKADSLGASLRVGFPLDEYSGFSMRYLAEETILKIDVASCQLGLISRSICDQVGRRASSVVGYSYSVDKRDDPIDPTRGATLSISQDVAGLGGDDQYLKTEVATSYYYPLFGKSSVLSFSWNAGYIWAFSNRPIRLNQRFFKGGASFRGFEIAGLGPRDLLTRDALGGKAYGIGTIELGIPTGLPKDYGVRAALFAQAGTLGLLDSQDIGTIAPGRVDSALKLRSSAGISLFWTSPFGPVRIDMAKTITKADYDKTESFRFSAGTRF
jgi:outer membrane protein insertion porin family